MENLDRSYEDGEGSDQQGWEESEAQRWGSCAGDREPPTGEAELTDSATIAADYVLADVGRRWDSVEAAAAKLFPEIGVDLAVASTNPDGFRRHWLELVEFKDRAFKAASEVKAHAQDPTDAYDLLEQLKWVRWYALDIPDRLASIVTGLYQREARADIDRLVATFTALTSELQALGRDEVTCALRLLEMQ
jgi:hypothetical protein